MPAIAHVQPGPDRSGRYCASSPNAASNHRVATLVALACCRMPSRPELRSWKNNLLYERFRLRSKTLGVMRKAHRSRHH